LTGHVRPLSSGIVLFNSVAFWAFCLVVLAAYY